MSALDVVPTLSPSMDIQVSSNFERLLFEMNGRDGGMTAEQLQRFRATGTLSVEDDQRAEWLDGRFLGARVDDVGTLDVIGRTYAATGMLVDPHTAVGLGAVEALRATGEIAGPVVTLATAHPAKFPDAVERATGVRPPLPAHLADLFDRPEHTDGAAQRPRRRAAVRRHHVRLTVRLTVARSSPDRRVPRRPCSRA